METFSYVLGWFIALSGLIINRWEPFKSERQMLAEQQFERFRSHRQLRVELGGSCDGQKLIADLREINGVRDESIDLDASVVSLSYHKEKVSEDEILYVLRKKGYIK